MADTIKVPLGANRVFKRLTDTVKNVQRELHLLAQQ